MPPEARSKAQRRADREAVGAYHEAQLAQLLEHVREGFARCDAGAIDAFELDDVIHQYKRAARELWKACVGAVGVLEDARDRAGELLGRPLLEDCTDRETGELTPVIVVTDNGACYRAAGFAARPELAHVRTRHKAPETNGVIERFFQSAKYEHVYTAPARQPMTCGACAARASSTASLTASATS